MPLLLPQSMVRGCMEAAYTSCSLWISLACSCSDHCPSQQLVALPDDPKEEMTLEVLLELQQ